MNTDSEAARQTALAADAARTADAAQAGQTQAAQKADAERAAEAALTAEAMLSAADARVAHAGPLALTSDSILAEIEAGVLVVDHYGSLRYANSFAADLFGFSEPGQLINLPFRALGFEEDDLGKVENLERQACRGRDWEGTLSVRRADGAIVFVRANAVPMRSPEGEITGTVITARQAVQLGGEPAVDRFGILDRIGERLAGSLELDVTLRQVAESLVPQFGDHCFIDLRHVETLMRRVEMHAWGWTPPEGTWKTAGEVISYPEGHFCYQAMEQKETVLVEDLREQNVPAPTPESLRVGLDVGLASVIASPLIARGQLLGVMSLGLSSLTHREAQHYVSDDRDFVAAIASRVAIAIDNAMLFEEERNTARNFQDSLLPNELPVLDGLDVAYRYVPANPLETHGQGIQTQVGGDWYDIIPLSAGRIGIVIGDVMGRGARAAAIMGQLRSALRAFAQDDKAPADILRRLDDWCRTLVPPRTDGGGEQTADSPIVSCTYLVYDPWSRKLTIANAGHMPPLIVTGADVEQMDFENQGVMLGVRSQGIGGLPMYREETRELPPGSTLIFYTDGLVDRRHRADGPGHYEDAEVLAMLCQTVQAVAQESVEKIADAIRHAVPGDIDDDMAIVVVRTSSASLASWDVKFAAEPIRVSEARKAAYETFVRWGMDADQVDLGCLLVSEVVTNVVLHASAAPSPRHEFALGSGLAALHDSLDDWDDSPYPEDFGGAVGQEFVLRIRKGEESIWVEVFDSDLRLPRIRVAGENDEGGRGLYLVDQLAARWGSRPTEDGKAVWFELPIKAGPASL